MKRRKFLVASAASLALPSIARAQGKRVLKFIPQSDLAILDPIWTTAYATRNHGYMVFDTLYGQSGEQNGFKTTPQMVAGHVIEDDGKTSKLMLREGLLFQDGQKVLASDCVASIRRWGVRDSFGQALMQRTDEISHSRCCRTRSATALPPCVPSCRNRRHRSVQAGHRDGRQRPVPIQGR